MARIPAEPEPCAVPQAKGNNGAVFALLRPVGLELGKGGSPGAVHQRRKPALQQVADFPLPGYEKVAGIAVRVVLDDEIAGAGLLITARGLDAVDQIQKQIFKKPYGNIIEVFFEPFVEQLDIEFARFLCAYGKRHQFTRLQVRFKTMDELKKFKTFAQEIIIQFQGRLDVSVGEQAQDIERDFVLPHQPDAPHDAVKAAVPGVVFPVKIVNLRRAVQTDADQKVFFAEKLAPCGVEQQAVGLQGIFNDLSVPGVFFLKGHDIPEEIDSHQERFTPLPAEAVERGIDGQGFSNDRLQYFSGHFGCVAGIKRFRPPVKAIIAGKIAQAGSRL